MKNSIGFRTMRFASATLLAAAFTVASSGSAQADPCLDAASGTSNNCTANDISISTITVSQVVDGCDGTPGDTFTFNGTLDVQPSANGRYDIGFFVGANPKTSTNGDCSVVVIPPSSGDLDGDACGDTVDSSLVNVPVTNLTAPCADSNGDGFFDVNSCSAWDSSSGAVCTGPADVVPGTKAKCNCEIIETTIPVPYCDNSTEPDPCDDGNACTNDTCNSQASGLGDFFGCSHTDNTNVCDDGNFCTTGDVCSAGTCGGAARDCGDANACTNDSCDEGADTCVNANNTDACDDGSFCTVGDVCGGGQCAGTARDCGDQNGCTTDSCDEGADTCVNANNTNACDDGSFCTVGDVCGGGTCNGTARNCADQNLCTTDSCNEGTDACVNANNTIACDDGSFCTVGDTCGNGQCAGSARNCGDGNACTDDTCDEEANSCVNADNTAPCNDGSFCTVDDTCDDGQCVGSARDCGDKNGCTTDSCNDDADTCVNANNAIACDDGSFCTVDDVCGNGVCAGAARDCGDQNGCTTDSCDDDSDACVNADNTDACNDGSFCTVGDTCDDGQCVGAPRDCGDAEACTTDSCDDEANACVNTPTQAECNDGLACTQNDTCASGTCEGTPVVCNDENGCTTDSCSEAGESPGCVFTNNTSACDDGSFCTVGDTCGEGRCSGTARTCDDSNGCTTDSCDEESNTCVNGNTTAACDDGSFCTVGDTCSNGACVGTARNCADENLCTTDSCNEATNACVNANNTISCNDGQFCTTNDTCSNGQCSGSARNCADTNVCTTDSCNEQTDSCVNSNNTTPCNDGQFCTVNDTCGRGQCTGAARACGDNTQCTVDSCNEEADSCQNVPNNNRCDDEDSCTVDTCNASTGCSSVFACKDICRRFGFYAKRSGDEREGANVTQAILDSVGGLNVCGQDVTETSFNGSVEGLGLSSALEGLCVHVDGVQERSLYRELVAAGLNCAMSGSDNCDAVIDDFVDVSFSACNSACALSQGNSATESSSNEDSFINTCTRELGCYNSGGRIIDGKCAYGNCDLTGKLCGGEYRTCPPLAVGVGIPTLQVCERFSDSCRNEPFCQEVLDICPSRLPVTSGDACKEARGNACTIDNCSIND